MNSDKSQRLVIVGGGLAAGEAAKTLLAEGFEGRLTIVAAEPSAPYDRPPLSKEYLRGEVGPEKLRLNDDAVYADERVDLLVGRRATALDVGGRNVRLDDGRTIAFDKILLATGARARRPDMPGVDLPFVHLLRTVGDADRLREAASSARTAVVAGGGWIAAEVAASLRQLGLTVNLVVPGREVLEKHLGREVAGRFTALHERHGVRVLRGARVVAVVEEPWRGVRLADGDVVSGDLVVLGFGAIPNDGIAADAGLAVADGILVDERLMTAVDGIFAAGDVASAWSPRYGAVVRSEHWDNARRQGRSAARGMLGRPETYDRLPFLYSDQFDLGIELIGRLEAWDEVAIRHPDDGDGFVVAWLREGVPVAAMHGNVWKAKKSLDALVSADERIDPRRFADPGISLDALTEAARAA